MGLEELKNHVIQVILELLQQANVDQLNEITVFIKNYIE